MAEPLRHLLFDFGDTLVREPFCVHGPPGVRDWKDRVLAAYAEPGLMDSWCLDRIPFEAVAARVAARCGMRPRDARAAMERDWRRLRVNARTLEFARELGRSGRAAVVTVNPRIFGEIIAPALGLHRDFAVIVTSWEERSLDKTDLCRVALDRLGAPGALDSALLVDNRADCAEAFRAAGGQALRFTDDAAFSREIPALRARLAV